MVISLNYDWQVWRREKKRKGTHIGLMFQLVNKVFYFRGNIMLLTPE